MNILILGGGGYVGVPLVERLLKESHQLRVIDTFWFGEFLQEHQNLEVIKGDIRDVQAINMQNVDVLIHLANIANDPCSDLNPKLSWETNVLATKFLVEKAIKNDVKQFIYASSGSVYGIKEEEQVTEDLDLVPISDYNKTKMVSERVLLSYTKDILVQIIRPATVCGYSPRMRLDTAVNMLSMHALKNGVIKVFGEKNIRPNIHIKDMIEVYLHCIKQGQELQGIYNAGFENISILNIAEKIIQKVDAKIEMIDTQDHRSYRLNSDKLLNTGFQPSFCVDDAIDEIANLYHKGVLKDENKFYNIKVMQNLQIS